MDLCLKELFIHRYLTINISTNKKGSETTDSLVFSLTLTKFH